LSCVIGGMTLSTRTCAGVSDEVACKVKRSDKH